MSEKTKMRIAEKIRRRGLEALSEALGPVDAVRFLQSFRPWERRKSEPG